MNVTVIHRVLIAGLLALLAAGCSGDMDDLMSYVDEVKARPGGRIEPLPQIKPYQTFSYKADARRSPFVQERGQATGQLAGGPKPDVRRPKEYLEGFPLDTLNMVGTLEREGRTYGLLQTQDGLVHRVLPGNYVGQNDGRVTRVLESGIEVEELVPDGIGGFFKRSAAIGLD